MSGDARQSAGANSNAQVRADRLEAVVDAIADGLLVYDADGQILRMNAAMRAMLHVDTSAELLVEPLERRMTQYGVTDETGSPLSIDAWPTVRVLRGEVLSGPTAPEYRVTLPDGAVLQVSMSGAPVRDHAGRIVNAVLVVRDVTERRELARQTRAALDALVAMARALLQGPPPRRTAEADVPAEAPQRSLGEQVVTLGRDILACRRTGLSMFDRADGPSRLLAVAGLDEVDIAGWWDALLRAIDANAAAFRRVRAALAAGEVVVGDTAAPPFNRVPNPLGIGTFLVAPIRSGECLLGCLFADFGTDAHRPDEQAALAQGVAALAALAIDRDRLVEASLAAARHAELDRLRGDFIAMISHDLQTPLTAVRAGLGLLATSLELQLDPDQQEILASTQFNVERLRGQINDLLAANQLSAGTLRLERSPFDLRSAVRNALAVVRPLLLDKRQEVAVAFPEPLPIVGDRRRLEHVLVNLLANAHRHTPPGSFTSIRGAADGAGVRIEVQDDGPGIPPEELERIFDRFHRLDDAATGSGLGLSIARALATMHGGRLWAESQPGAGATFVLTLPAPAKGEQKHGAEATDRR